MTPFEILGAVADLLGILGFLSPIAYYYLIKKNLPARLYRLYRLYRHHERVRQNSTGYMDYMDYMDFGLPLKKTF